MNELTIHTEAQGSPEWLELRRSMRTASETPLIMGTSKWGDPAEVFDRKVGGAQFEGNVATEYGTRTEPRARSVAEMALRLEGAPRVGSRGPYLASLDFIGTDDFGSTLVVDIKCPFSKEKSSTWKAASRGEIEPGYADQLEHQYRVFLPDTIGLFVYIADDKHLFVPYTPSEARWEQITKAWDEFWLNHIVTGVRPSEYLKRTDQDWLLAAQKWVGMKLKLEEAEKAEAAARAELLAVNGDRKSEGAGVRVNRFFSRGSIDYKAALTVAAPQFDAEPFRKEPSEKVTVTQIKESK